MKKNVLNVLLFCIPTFIFSQDYKQKIAKSICECFTKVKSENTNPKNLETQFGICIIKGAQPFAKELKRDYTIDLRNDDVSILGKTSAPWILAECPDTFNELLNVEENTEDSTRSELLISGTITKIEKENFIIFHLVGENKNLTKLYWVSNIESNLDLPKEYSTLLNKKVSISYYTTEIFDVKINDYRNLNIISGLKTD